MVSQAIITLNERYKSTLQAHASLKKAVAHLEKIMHEKPDDKYLIEVSRNSLVKVFEITFDIFWKYVKDYLSMIHGFEQGSPKNVFRELLKVAITNKQETSLLLDMVDDRNRLVHTYNEQLPIKISYNIPAYFYLMEKLLKELQPSEELI